MKMFKSFALFIIGLLFSSQAFAITIEGELSFPNGSSVTNFTRNVIVFAQNPLNVSQSQLLTVSLPVGQASIDYTITLPDNGHDWIIRYICSLCNQEGLLTEGYVGPLGTVTTAEDAISFDGAISHTNVNINLIGGLTIEGELSFPNGDQVTNFTRNVIVFAQNPFNVSQSQILTVSLPVGQASIDYSITLPDNGHDWIIRYVCTLCNQEGLLTEGYVGSLGTVTTPDDAVSFAGGISHTDVNIRLVSGVTIEGELSFPSGDQVTNFTRNVIVFAQNPLNVSQSQLLTVPLPVGQSSTDYSITLPDNGHDWIIRYVCSLCNQEGLLTEGYVGSLGTVTSAEEAVIFEGEISHTDVNINLITGVTIAGQLSFPSGGQVTNFTRNVIVLAQNPLDVTQFQILTVALPVGQASTDYAITLPDNGHEWILRYACTLCNQEGLLTEGYVGPLGTVTSAEEALSFDGGVSHTDVNISLIGGVTIEGELRFPSADQVTNFTRNVIVVAQNPLNVSQSQVLTVSLLVGQTSTSYAITLPDNGHDWIIKYVCTLCNQEGLLTQAYVGPLGMVTLSSEAMSFSGGINHSNVNISLIGETPDFADALPAILDLILKTP